VPFYQDPNRASRALASLLQYACLRTRPLEPPAALDRIDTDRARAILRRHWKEARAGFLDGVESAEVAAAYGIRVPRVGIASTADEAVALASEIGYPVAMKVHAPGVIHKADVGGVRLNLRDDVSVRATFDAMIAGRSGWRAMLQQMAPAGQEMIVGVHADPQFGPVLMAGLGGTLVEVLHDAAFRLAPLSAGDALEMISETAAGQILQGVRGAAPGDRDAVVDAILRIGQMASDFPCIAELDVNPLIVGEAGAGAWAVDVRIALNAEPD